MRGLGQCLDFKGCDGYHPVCEPGCGDNQYCATDCTCRNVDDPLPDVVVSFDKLAEQIHFQTQEFSESDCALQEGILNKGARRLVRFTVETLNQGRAILELGDPSLRPDMFVYSPCHGHYHFSGYAAYKLLSATEPYDEVVSGHKQGYCVYDAYRRLNGMKHFLFFYFICYSFFYLFLNFIFVFRYVLLYYLSSPIFFFCVFFPSFFQLFPYFFVVVDANPSFTFLSLFLFLSLLSFFLFSKLKK